MLRKIPQLGESLCDCITAKKYRSKNPATLFRHANHAKNMVHGRRSESLCAQNDMATEWQSTRFQPTLASMKSLRATHAQTSFAAQPMQSINFIVIAPGLHQRVNIRNHGFPTCNEMNSTGTQSDANTLLNQALVILQHFHHTMRKSNC